jgi:hypothetical protein
MCVVELAGVRMQQRRRALGMEMVGRRWLRAVQLGFCCTSVHKVVQSAMDMGRDVSGMRLQ